MYTSSSSPTPTWLFSKRQGEGGACIFVPFCTYNIFVYVFHFGMARKRDGGLESVE